MSAARRDGRTKPGNASASRAKCPICRKPVSADYRPFCSKHCADIDLGRWLEGRYAVAGERVGESQDGADEEGD